MAKESNLTPPPLPPQNYAHSGERATMWYTGERGIVVTGERRRCGVH